MAMGNFPERLSQRISVGMILVGRLGVHLRLTDKSAEHFLPQRSMGSRSPGEGVVSSTQGYSRCSLLVCFVMCFSWLSVVLYLLLLFIVWKIPKGNPLVVCLSGKLQDVSTRNGGTGKTCNARRPLHAQGDPCVPKESFGGSEVKLAPDNVRGKTEVA